MVKIHLCPGLFGKVTIVNAETKEELWQGKSGVIAEIDVTGTVPIEIIWGILQTPNVKENVTEGEEYELIFRMTTFKSEYYLVKWEDENE